MATDAPLSVVIPAYNEGQNLRCTVNAVRNTVERDHELIVVDDGSTDGSAETVSTAHDRRVRVVRTRRLGPARARNAGAAAARGSVLIFLDAHCVPAHGALDRLAAAAAADAESIYTGCIASLHEPQRRGWGLTLTSRTFDVGWLGQQQTDACDVPVAGGACLAMPAALFARLRGFAPFRTKTLEDTELSVRAWGAGARVRVLPDCVVQHRFKADAWTPARRERYLRDALLVAALHLRDAHLARTLDGFAEWRGFEPAWRHARRRRSAAARRLGLDRRTEHFASLCERFRIAW